MSKPDWRLLTGCQHGLHETCPHCSCPCCGTRAVEVQAVADAGRKFWLPMECAVTYADWVARADALTTDK